jgi:hypothetical protein
MIRKILEENLLFRLNYALKYSRMLSNVYKKMTVNFYLILFYI